VEYPDTILIGVVNEQLHKDRVTRYLENNPYRENLDRLPNGVFIELDDTSEAAWLIWNGELMMWQPDGYGKRRKKIPGIEVRVLTPESTVKSISAGYCPHVHHIKER